MKLLNPLLIILGIFGLIAVRMVEEHLFYDPFLDYFHAANKQAPFPVFEWPKLIINYMFRFALNLILSALIVHFIFRNREWTVQAVVLILLVFAITFPIYL
ncbi:MAG: exosortase F system-associated membrane protein, partial [Kaistella sp.]